MSLLRIAIVGRPNVGKSSLLNMLAGAKVSIVDPTPGVTRDRVTAVVEIPSREPGHEPKLVEIIDTGGFGVYVAEGGRHNEVGEDLTRLTPQIEAQIASAVASADLVLFVIDAQAGVVAADHEFAKLLREGTLHARAHGPRKTAGKIGVVANKVDDSSWEGHAFEAATLGFGEPLPVSASSNYLRRDFVERVYALLPEEREGETDPVELSDGSPPVMRLAIVGKRNAGKSTFVNALAGEERVIVSEIAGTTRDAVDVRFEKDGKTFVAIDTAGVRKRKSLADQVEWWALDRMRRAVLRADVVLFLLDATTPISAVDQQLSSEIQAAFKPCVVLVNKWDLVEGKADQKGRPLTTDLYREYIDKELKGLDHCPIAFTSAIRGAEEGGGWETLGVAFELFEQARKRIGTGELNRTLRQFTDSLPASKLGRRLKLFYATQIQVAPPTIAMVVNDPGLCTPQAERFLLNRIRESTPFAEVPVRLIIRGRRKDERDIGRPGAPTPDLGSPAPTQAQGPRVEGISEEEFYDIDLTLDGR